MDKTTFAGLTRLDQAESFSTDGYSFQHDNPTIIDRLLQVGAVTHRHDGHAPLADPTDDPTVASVAGGGSILASETVTACYTLIDADGGETRPSTAVAITTPAPIDPPNSGPTVALDTSAGTLLVNTYLYAITFTDASGGETTVGPSSLVVRPPGSANARVLISGLTALMTGAGAAGWRLWRSVGGGRWGYLAAGTGDTFTDDGSASPDCTMNPPSRNTTNGVNKIDVTVPATQPAGTVSYRIYLSTDGSFESPAVAGTYLIVTAGSPVEYTTIDLADGRPPDVSRSLPGASRIDAQADLDNLYFRSPVANLAALPALGNVTGDVRQTLDDHALHTWDGAAWVSAGGGGGGGGTALDAWQAVTFNAGFPHWRSITASTTYGAWRDTTLAPPPAAFCKGGGIVYLRGGVEVYGIPSSGITFSGPGGNMIFQLPVGYRPDTLQHFTVPYYQRRDSRGGTVVGFWWWVTLVIDTDGKGYVVSNRGHNNYFDGSNHFFWNGEMEQDDQFSLENISFRAA